MSSESRPEKGRLFVVSAPSGTGKTTLVERLVERVPRLRMSRSYTSRGQRPGETDQVDYNFITREAFEAMIRRGDFLEWADVFGDYYGTGAADTAHALAEGNDVVLVIDVQGARQVRQSGRPVVTVFVLPPSFEVLEQRLRRRSQDSDMAIRRRLAVASSEVRGFDAYDYVVVNDGLEAALARLEGIIVAERAKMAVMRPEAERIVRTFELNR